MSPFERRVSVGQIIIIMNVVAVASVGIKRVDCSNCSNIKSIKALLGNKEHINE